MIALLIGVTTAVVDYFVHPGMIGPAYFEAALTGLGAAGLSYLVGWIIHLYRTRRAAVAAATENN